MLYNKIVRYRFNKAVSVVWIHLRLTVSLEREKNPHIVAKNMLHLCYLAMSSYQLRGLVSTCVPLVTAGQ